MSVCRELAENASAGVAPALRAIDCLTGEVTASAFGRLFGQQGLLLPALTILLTLYIGFFALGLLTGRSRVGIAALTPRVITLGLVLTFATSWIAYQGVVWNLATGAPDQIAGVLMGTDGPASRIFADRTDMVFAAIAEAAQSSAEQGNELSGQPAGAAPGNFTPANLMWISALLLLLGTVGVLLTARIALAILLALGPVFMVFALFSGTRGLFAGWLRGMVLTALVPLFVVAGGGLMFELLVPLVGRLQGPEGIDGRAAIALFVVAAVYLAMVVMMLKVSTSIVTGWSVFGADQSRDEADGQSRPAGEARRADPAAAAPMAPSSTPPRRVVAGAAMAGNSGQSPGTGQSVSPSDSRSRARPAQVMGIAQHSAYHAPRRASGIGSRFRQPYRLGAVR